MQRNLEIAQIFRLRATYTAEENCVQHIIEVVSEERRKGEGRGEEEEGGERSIVYKIYHSVCTWQLGKHITYLPSAVSLGNHDINTERLGSHAALSAPHVMVVTLHCQPHM